MTNFPRQAIILVSFGVYNEKIRNSTVDALANEISANFTDFEVHQAFTSNFIIKKLAQLGIKISTVEEKISELRAEGFTKIILLPTHLTAGEEFDNKIKVHMSEDVQILSPLFSLKCDTDFDKKILDEILNCFPTNGEDLILIGHGSPHRHNSVYENFQRLIDENYKNIHVGVIEENDTPNFNDVVGRLKNKNVEKLLLAPLLFNGGSHLSEDVAGHDKNSWRSKFMSLGYDVEIYEAGLGTFRNFRELYLQKIFQVS